MKTQSQIPDLVRRRCDQVRGLPGATLYRWRNVVQIWYDARVWAAGELPDPKETWTFPDTAQAAAAFARKVDRLNEEGFPPVGDPRTSRRYRGPVAPKPIGIAFPI